MAYCLCNTCGLRFSSENTFTQHRVGEYQVLDYTSSYKIGLKSENTRHCLTPDEMIGKKMHFNQEKQVWMGEPMDDSLKQRIRGRQETA